MCDYVAGLGDYWIRLLEQMIPASTIWIGGVKYENSIFHRQKFAYRIQRGCRLIPIPCIPCVLNSDVFSYDCVDEQTECPIYPWDNNILYQSFEDVLYETVNNYVTSSGLTCDLNSLTTDWYIEISLDNQVVLKQYIYTGYGLYDAPSSAYWRQQLALYLPTISDQYLTYFLNGNTLYVSNAGCDPLFLNKKLELKAGLDFILNCE